jgi:hypothetical protein
MTARLTGWQDVNAASRDLIGVVGSVEGRLSENPNISEQTIREMAGHVSKEMMQRYVPRGAQERAHGTWFGAYGSRGRLIKILLKSHECRTYLFRPAEVGNGVRNGVGILQAEQRR